MQMINIPKLSSVKCQFIKLTLHWHYVARGRCCHHKLGAFLNMLLWMFALICELLATVFFVFLFNFDISIKGIHTNIVNHYKIKTFLCFLLLDRTWQVVEYLCIYFLWLWICWNSAPIWLGKTDHRPIQSNNIQATLSYPASSICWQNSLWTSWRLIVCSKPYTIFSEVTWYFDTWTEKQVFKGKPVVYHLHRLLQCILVSSVLTGLFTECVAQKGC